jgi:hypothetical protein
MSYDILVFDPAHAPREREAFLQWWDAQAERSEPYPFDPAVTTPSLRAWFMEMIERFPALNGPYALDFRRGQRDQRAADYCIGDYLIYAAFWSDTHGAYERARELAGKHHLGFYEVSSPDGEIWLPGVGDELVLASKHEHRRQNPEPVTDPRIAALVRSHPPDSAVVVRVAQVENLRRTVNVVYSRRWIEAVLPDPLLRQGTLAELERALAEAGIAYAIVEQDEQRAFLAESASPAPPPESVAGTTSTSVSRGSSPGRCARRSCHRPRRSRLRSDCAGPSLRCGLGRLICVGGGPYQRIRTKRERHQEFPRGNQCSSVGLATYCGARWPPSPQQTIGHRHSFARYAFWMH